MKRATILFSAIVLGMAMFFGACSKDDDDNSNPAPPPEEVPEYGGQTVTIPDAMMQSQDPGAQQAVAYIDMANGFVEMAGSFGNPPEKSSSFKSTNGDGPPWVYNWEVNDETGNYTVTLTINETGDGTEWDIVVNGVMDGITLDNFTIMHGEQSDDGKNGSFTVYDWENQGGEIFEITWNTDDDGNYFIHINIPESVKIDVVANADGSGSVAFYQWNETDFELMFKAVWDAEGSGEWWQYEGGELIDHGTW
jgi:hypothetical protein